jgi:hypothetical protein
MKTKKLHSYRGIFATKLLVKILCSISIPRSTFTYQLKNLIYWNKVYEINNPAQEERKLIWYHHDHYAETPTNFTRS